MKGSGDSMTLSHTFDETGITGSTTPAPSHTLLIVGRRWFQRTYGNTYHSAEVVIDGEVVARTGKHYGYDDSYIYTALVVAEAAGLLPVREKYDNGGYRELFREFYARHGYRYETRVVDVPRERDL